MKPCIVLSLLVAVSAAACSNLPRSRDLANPQVSGRTLAEQVCSNCHGVTGSAVSPNFPNLAAQQRAYLTGQLTAFRGHSRRDPAGYEYMWGISRRLTDEQIAALADYYAAQTPRAQPPERSAAEIDAGAAIFARGIPEKAVPPCGSCHGPQAAGQAAFPRLAGQHADYIAKQLSVFQRTDERPEGAVMKTVAHLLSSEDI
ncbi:MAG TPA: c-type cytochrome, partial [Rudaea sp.]|nr:c-type cytochrome [Rudaea sp.]